MNPFFFLSSSSHLFINNNAIPNPIFFTFFKNHNLGTESNHFHYLLPHQTPSYSHCNLCTVQTRHRSSCRSETHSIPNPFITHPTRNPLMIWWFDQCGLMIGEAFIWWFDWHGWGLAWFDDRWQWMIGVVWWSAIGVVWWFISSSGLMIDDNRGMIWSNEEMESEVRVIETQWEGERRNY